jgi:cellulose synthase/poly-beta-1,6-N-acetylglucosamine synthase-like glycosyltransferase
VSESLPIGAATLILLHYGCLAALSCLGIHRLWLLWVLWRLPKREATVPEPAAWPPVLVQLPLYNEAAVAERLLRACAALDYEPGKLHLQVLDDSTGEARLVVRAVLADLEGQDLPIRLSLHRRDERSGFKAGALAEGLADSDEPLVALFDADFVPPPDFLRKTVPALLAEERLAFVQAPWGHLNRHDSLLTVAQAAILDGHFRGEHRVLSALGLPFNFNGTAGVWRRSAIEAAGGWHRDTLTEDLDLSLRAFLAGWNARLLPEAEAPAELPATWSALRSQQARWARGSIQCARKLLRPLWTSRLPLLDKAEATIALLSNLAWPLLLTLILLSLPVFYVRQAYDLGALLWVDLSLLLPATGAFFAYYVAVGRGSPWQRLVGSAAGLLLGIGLAANNSKAVLQGLLGGVGVFIRTPKTGGEVSAVATPKAAAAGRPVELLLSAWLAALVCLEVWLGVWVAVPFSAFFLGGMVWAASDWAAPSAPREALALDSTPPIND